MRRHDQALELTCDDLHSFPWTTAVVKESLRMWPTVTPQLGLQRCGFTGILQSKLAGVAQMEHEAHLTARDCPHRQTHDVFCT